MHLQVALHAAGESGWDSDLAARLSDYEPIKDGGGLYLQLKLALWLCICVLYMSVLCIHAVVVFAFALRYYALYALQSSSWIFSMNTMYRCARCSVQCT